jgi:hypothetical protein
MSLEAGLAAEEASGLRGFRNGVFLYQFISVSFPIQFFTTNLLPSAKHSEADINV